MTRRLARLLPATCTLLTGCGALDRGFLSPAGPIASAIRDEFFLVCLVTLLVITPVLILTPLIAWHYRLSNTKSAYRPRWAWNWWIEGLIWIPPIGIVIFLGVFLWRDTQELDPYKPLPGAALEVQVVAMDWKWLFIYPEQGVATVNRLIIPAGQAVHLSLTSATVMQSILMPRLAGQITVMAGMRTQLNLAADAPGSYFGENVQFNGMGFQNQKFTVDSMAPAAFVRWVAQTRAQPNRLDPAAYEVLSHRSVLPAPLAFGAVQPDLFQHILSLSQPSGHTLSLQKLGPPVTSMPMETPKHDD